MSLFRLTLCWSCNAASSCKFWPFCSNVTEQLRRFIEAAHIQDNLNIAGHSLGGTIAMFYASQYPFDTKSLF